jgi:hypothetical protein
MRRQPFECFAADEARQVMAGERACARAPDDERALGVAEEFATNDSPA